MNISFDSGGKPQGPLAKALAVIVGALTLAGAFMFSLVFLVVIAVGVLVVWLYFWWRTRALRRQMRDELAQMQAAAEAMHEARFDGDDTADVIEGEAVRIVDEKHRLPE